MASPTTAPAWRRVFLRELARGGSVALAAQACGIDRTSPYQTRKRSPAFAASWDRALAAARSRLTLGGAGGDAPAPRLREDQMVRSSRTGRVCIVRVGEGRWSAGTERKFLAHLVATANVKAAARAVGVSSTSAYNRRKLWPAFAAEWAAAKREGYERIEMLLICAATNALDREPDPADYAHSADRTAGEMTIDQAMRVYDGHRASEQRGREPRYGWRQRLPPIEEVDAEILRRVAAMARIEDDRAGQPKPDKPEWKKAAEAAE